MKWLLRRRVNKSEIEADIETYLDEKTDALIASGLTPEEARQRARREFGNVTLTKELSGEEWNWGFVERTWADLRYALRSLGRNPAFALTAILTLALGIGANAAIFSLLHAVILRTLPVPNAEQLRLLTVIRDQKEDESIFSFPVLREMQTALGDKAALTAFASISQMKSVGVSGEDKQVNVQLVSGNFFDVLGVKAQAGHLLSASDDDLNGTYPAVLSDAYWSKNYANDPSVIGRSLTLNGTPVTVVGVAAKGFFGVTPGNRLDFWLPLSAQHDVRYNRNVWSSNGDSSKSFLPQWHIRWLSFLARIPDSREEPRVAAVVNQVYGRDMQREVKNGWDDPVEIRIMLQSKVRLDAGDKGMGNLRRQFSEPLTVLMGAAGLVLLIASVNLASLALARVIARRKEIAVRCSIGATRGRIISQFLTEVLVLSITGGLVAIPVALGAAKLLVRWASNGDPMPLNIGLDSSMLLFVLLASVVAGIVFGLLPALEAINFPLADAMKTHASAVKGMRLPWGRTLIAIQVMFSFVLLTGAVLFVRTFMNYANVQLGFVPEHVLSVYVDPLGAHYSTEQLIPTYHRVLESLQAIPGVQSASFSDCGLARGCKSTSGVEIEGKPGQNQEMQENYVNPEYFSTVGMRLVAGRLFDHHDVSARPLFAVINAAAAKKFYPGVNPLGRHFGSGQNPFEVIGVLANARVNDVHEEAAPMAYYSLEQSPHFARALEVRAQGDPKVLEQSIRNAIRASAPTLPVMEVRLLTEQVSSNLLRERLVARLASAFAGLALGLACLGVYGVLSYAISRRTSELGIRLALGAEVSSLRWMVLREALAVILIGLGLGIPVAVAATRLIKGLLYGLSAGDPTSMGLGAFALLGIGFMAAFVPAWRASRVDPNVALRYE
jgi:predicted permease